MARKHVFVNEDGEVIDRPDCDEYGNQLPVHAVNEHGEEVMDETPISVPLRPAPASLGMLQQIRSLIAGELSRKAGDDGFESFEEANDFEVGDYQPYSPYELSLDQELDQGGLDDVGEGILAAATSADQGGSAPDTPAGTEQAPDGQGGS